MSNSNKSLNCRSRGRWFLMYYFWRIHKKYVFYSFEVWVSFPRKSIFCLCLMFIEHEVRANADSQPQWLSKAQHNTTHSKTQNNTAASFSSAGRFSHGAGFEGVSWYSANVLSSSVTSWHASPSLPMSVAVDSSGDVDYCANFDRPA